MPRLKEQKLYEPLWKEWNYKADKSGLRHTVYNVNGDRYTGAWLHNKKHGKGTQKWSSSGHLYEGSWECGKQNGFGDLSVLVDKVNDKYKKIYSGYWKDGKKHGEGTMYYDDDYYEGGWHMGERCGWGRMHYQDGSVYEGEWCNDKQDGTGMMRSTNTNRYEGEWRNGLKHGKGKYFYIDNGQIMEGLWVNGVCKCGEMKDFDRRHAPQPTPYEIPQVKLLNPTSVLEKAEKDFSSDQEDCE